MNIRYGGDRNVKRKILVVVTACIVFFSSITFATAASSLLVDIRAQLNKEVKITIDGVPWQPKLGETVLYPITYNGVTYLPIRSISEALDVPIRWEQETKTVHIGGTSEVVPILNESYRLLSASITEDENDRKIQGEDYGKVIWFSKILHSPSQFMLEPSAQFTKLVLKVGIEGDDTRIELEDTNGPSVIKSVLLTEEDGVTEIEADIKGVQQVRLVVKAEEPNTSSMVKIVAAESYYKNEE